MKSIHVLRKPCSESTVAANVLRHGTGGINVDGSRIAWANEADAAAVSAVTTSFIKTTTTGQGASLGFFRFIVYFLSQQQQRRRPLSYFSSPKQFTLVICFISACLYVFLCKSMLQIINYI